MKMIVIFLLSSAFSLATGLERAAGIITLYETPRGDDNLKQINNLLGFFPEPVREKYRHSILALRNCLGSNSAWKKYYYSSMLSKHMDIEKPYTQWFLCAQKRQNELYDFFALEKGTGNKFLRFYVTPDQCEPEAIIPNIKTHAEESLRAKIYCAGTNSIAQYDWLTKKWHICDLMQQTKEEVDTFDNTISYTFKS